MTSDPAQSLAAATTIVKRLLSAMGVTCVVAVDDAWVPETRGLIEAAELSPIGGHRFDPAHGRSYSEWLADIWPDLTDKQLIEGRRLAALRSPELVADPLDVLAVICSKAGEFKPLLPVDWEEQRDAIIKRHGAANVLVLFDRVIEGDSARGEDLLALHLESHPDGYAAMISSKIHTAEELERQGQIAERLGVPREKILLASKDHLSADLCEEFSDFLRHAVNAHNLRTIRDEVLRLASAGHKKGLVALQDMPLRILEDVVLRSSRVEGAYEPDTLVRALNIETAADVRDALATLEPASELRDAIRAARRLAEIHFRDDPASREQAEELLAKERFLTAEAINLGGLPVANGDVFEIDGEQFVLLEQPCDLVMRDKVSGSRDHLHAEFFRLGPSDATSHERREWRLPAYSPWAQDEPLYVLFSRTRSLPLRIVDLCSFNTGGAAQIDVAAEAPEVEPLTPGLQRRYKQLRDRAGPLLETVNGVPPELESVRERLLLIDDLAGRVDATILSWPVRRVGRLARPVAAAALAAQTTDANRPAEPHALDRFTPTRARQRSLEP